MWTCLGRVLESKSSGSVWTGDSEIYEVTDSGEHQVGRGSSPSRPRKIETQRLFRATTKLSFLPFPFR